MKKLAGHFILPVFFFNISFRANKDFLRCKKKLLITYILLIRKIGFVWNYYQKKNNKEK